MPDSHPELSAALVEVFDHVHVVERWITPLAESLVGADAAEAAWKPGPDERSLWDIVLHVAAWTEWVVAFLDGRDTEVTDWPPLGRTDPAAWEADRQRLDAALAAFRERLAALTPEALAEPPTPAVTPTTRLMGAMSILVHNAYHAGQVTKLRAEYARRRVSE